jgi:beta-lactamase class A
LTPGRAIIGFACLAPIAGLFPLSAADTTAAILALRTRIESQAAGGPGIPSVAFRDFQTNESIFIHADGRTHAASLMKLPVMMAAFERAGRGELDLSQPILVRDLFHSIIEGEPFTVPIDPASPLYPRKGQRMPLRELIGAMITRSDNTATNLLIERIGAARVNDLARRLGTRHTKILRGVEDNRAYEAGISNEASAADMLTLLAACRESPLFTSASREEMLAILRRQQHHSMIAQGIPAGSGAVVANKTGSISWVEHDAGIVDLPGGRSYGIVIMTHGFADKRDEAIRTGAAISRSIYEHVSSR